MRVIYIDQPTIEKLNNEVNKAILGLKSVEIMPLIYVNSKYIQAILIKQN